MYGSYSIDVKVVLYLFGNNACTPHEKQCDLARITFIYFYEKS